MQCIECRSYLNVVSEGQQNYIHILNASAVGYFVIQARYERAHRIDPIVDFVN
jgi:hypothetical protein